MTNRNVKISTQQARDFAQLIVSDIKEFVAAHQAEFEEFLRAEAEEGRGW